MSSFLQALQCKNKTDRYPVWLMRQAGRYLPNYQAFRNKHSLKTLFTSPELAAEVSLLPFHYFDLDAAIVFWDIVLIAEEIGFEVDYLDKLGPVAKFTNKKRDTHYLLETIARLKNKLDVPLIGFCGAPFTVAFYLLDDIKKWIYQKPQELHDFLSDLTEATIQNLKGQIKAGVDAIQIFESSAYLLSESSLKEFSYPYVQRICSEIDALKIVFAKGSSTFVEMFSKLKTHAISFDWNRDLAILKRKVPSNMAIQGNFDPDFLFAPKEKIEKMVHSTLKQMNNDPGLIINLGHGIRPNTPIQSVQWFVRSVQNFSRSNSRSLDPV